MIKQHILALEHSTFLHQVGNQTQNFRLSAPAVHVSGVPAPEFRIPAQDFHILAPESIFLGNQISKCQTTWI